MGTFFICEFHFCVATRTFTVFSIRPAETTTAWICLWTPCTAALATFCWVAMAVVYMLPLLFLCSMREVALWTFWGCMYIGSPRDVVDSSAPSFFLVNGKMVFPFRGERARLDYAPLKEVLLGIFAWFSSLALNTSLTSHNSIRFHINVKSWSRMGCLLQNQFPE